MHATLPVGSAPGVGPATPGTPGSTPSTAPPPPAIVQPVLPETPIPPAGPPVVKTKYQRFHGTLGWSFKGDHGSAYIRKYNLVAEDCSIEGR